MGVEISGYGGNRRHVGDARRAGEGKPRLHSNWEGNKGKRQTPGQKEERTAVQGGEEERGKLP